MNLFRIMVFCLTGLICCPIQNSAAPPSAPENLQPAWLFGEIMLTWAEVPATGYNVYRYDGDNALWVSAATNLTVPRFREYAQGPAIYSVTAFNADGESVPAGPVLAEQTGESFVLSTDQWAWSIYDTTAVIQ